MKYFWCVYVSICLSELRMTYMWVSEWCWCARVHGKECQNSGKRLVKRVSIRFHEGNFTLASSKIPTTWLLNLLPSFQFLHTWLEICLWILGGNLYLCLCLSSLKYQIPNTWQKIYLLILSGNAQWKMLNVDPQMFCVLPQTALGATTEYLYVTLL